MVADEKVCYVMRKELDYGLLHAMTAFLRVVDAGTFTAAASHMDLSTAQVSRLVSELEGRLRTKLLQRTTRRLVLTTIGARYAEQCRTILELVADAESGAMEAGAVPTGRLKVLCMSAFGSRYVVPLISKFCAMYPKVNIDYSTSQQGPDLLADGVDVSVYLAQELPDSSSVAVRIGETHGVLCAAPSYAMQHGALNTIDELSGHACLRLVNPSIAPHWSLTDGKTTKTLMPHGPLVGDSPDVVLHGARSGLGVAMLPIYSAVDAIRSGELVHVLPQWRSSPVGVYVMTPTRQFIERKTRAWLELLQSEVPIAMQRDTLVTGKRASAAK